MHHETAHDLTDFWEVDELDDLIGEPTLPPTQPAAPERRVVARARPRTVPGPTSNVRAPVRAVVAAVALCALVIGLLGVGHAGMRVVETERASAVAEAALVEDALRGSDALAMLAPLGAKVPEARDAWVTDLLGDDPDAASRAAREVHDALQGGLASVTAVPTSEAGRLSELERREGSLRRSVERADAVAASAARADAAPGARLLAATGLLAR